MSINYERFFGAARFNAVMKGVKAPNSYLQDMKASPNDNYSPAIMASHNPPDLRLYRKVPDAQLMYMYLLEYANKGNALYADDRRENIVRIGMCAIVLRERGYDPADIDDLRERLMA